MMAEWKDDCLGLTRVVRTTGKLPMWLAFPGWKDSHRPIDDSPEDMLEWLEHALARVRALALRREVEDDEGRELCDAAANALVAYAFILVNHLRGKGWRHLPSETASERTTAEASIELRRIRDAIADQPEADEWLPADLPSSCAKALGISLSTLKRYEKDGKVRIDKLAPKRWRIHKADAAKLQRDD